MGRSLVSKMWVEERRRKWGEGDPRWSSKVLGIAPQDNPTGTIPYSAVVAAISSDPDDERVPPVRRPDGRVAGYRWGALPDLPAWGLDVAAGGDRTVLWERRGRFLARRWEIRTADADAQVDGLRARAAEWGAPERLVFDVTGLGWGLLAPLRAEAKDRDSPLYGVDVVPLNFGSAGSAPGKDSPGFVKARDELWCKDETKRRLGRSPDDADAILLSLWQGPTRRGRAPSASPLAASVTRR
jgi:hypothetical protein